MNYWIQLLQRIDNVNLAAKSMLLIKLNNYKLNRSILHHPSIKRNQKLS